MLISRFRYLCYGFINIRGSWVQGFWELPVLFSAELFQNKKVNIKKKNPNTFSWMMTLLLGFSYGGSCYLRCVPRESENPAHKQSLRWVFESWCWRSTCLSVLEPRGPDSGTVSCSASQADLAFAEQLLAHSEGKSGEFHPGRYQD